MVKKSTPSCSFQWSDVSVEFFEFSSTEFAACLKLPSRDNYSKASYPKTQQRDQPRTSAQVAQRSCNQGRHNNDAFYLLDHANSLYFFLIAHCCFFSDALKKNLATCKCSKFDLQSELCPNGLSIRQNTSTEFAILYQGKLCSCFIIVSYFQRIQYGILIWGNAAKIHLQELSVRMNNILRSITFSSKYCKMTILYQKLNVFKLANIYGLELAKYMHQLHNNELSFSLFENVKLNEIHSHNTRQTQNAVYFNPRAKNLLKKSY